MSRKKRKAPSPPSEPTTEEETGPPRALLVIAGFFLVIGSLMLLAHRGELRPLPADHQGPTPAYAAMNARDMRAYGAFSIVLGLAAVGFYIKLSRKKPEG